MDTTLNIRNIDSEAVYRAKRAAARRGLTIGRYFERLLSFHEACRVRGDDGDEVIQQLLEAWELETTKG